MSNRVVNHVVAGIFIVSPVVGLRSLSWEHGDEHNHLMLWGAANMAVELHLCQVLPSCALACMHTHECTPTPQTHYRPRLHAHGECDGG